MKSLNISLILKLSPFKSFGVSPSNGSKLIFIVIMTPVRIKVKKIGTIISAWLSNLLAKLINPTIDAIVAR